MVSVRLGARETMRWMACGTRMVRPISSVTWREAGGAGSGAGVLCEAAQWPKENSRETAAAAIGLRVECVSIRNTSPHCEKGRQRKSPIRAALGLKDGASSREKRNLRGTGG